VAYRQAHCGDNSIKHYQGFIIRVVHILFIMSRPTMEIEFKGFGNNFVGDCRK
jgi:hypothetical protein